MKSQDTVAALEALAACAPPSTPIVCAQNGVDNERSALRHFENVYGMCVMCPATHLDPGVVQASSSPVTGLMDVGRWPSGSRRGRRRSRRDALARRRSPRCPREDIATVEVGQAAHEPRQRRRGGLPPRRVGSRARRAGARRGRRVPDRGGRRLRRPPTRTRHVETALLTSRPIGERRRAGGSTWQSLTRSKGEVETDFLTGEVVLLGRLVGVATPVNERLQSLANELARSHEPPGDEVGGGGARRSSGAPRRSRRRREPVTSVPSEPERRSEGGRHWAPRS